jgi:hypothetical protein
MAAKSFGRYIASLAFVFLSLVSFGQDVPLGIFYQAVARDNFGKELASRDIDVKFSIIIENPLGTVVYQELHSDVITSKYGVFSLIIGHGIPTGGIYGELSQVNWSQAFHYLKVEVKFENDFIDMGTMQFLAVPYALYAQRSLEPGPAGPRGDAGPKGDPGDPASDKQTISFDQSNLTISGGNSVPLTSLLQNLTITNSPEGNYLGISRGNSVLLATIEADGDPTNEIQDLTINSDKLKITKNPQATEWDLTRYLDNTDNQALSWNPVSRTLGISGNTGTVNLSELKNDADADPTNEIQDIKLTEDILTIDKNPTSTGVNLSIYRDNTDNQQLTYTASNNTLSITGGNSITLGTLIAFRAKKSSSETVPSFMSDYDFIAGTLEYNDGSGYDNSTGVFSVPFPGIYTFNVSYNATGSADSRILKIFLNGSLYETLNSGITAGSSLTRQITMKLSAGDKVKVIINVGTGFETGIGSFSGFRVY